MPYRFRKRESVTSSVRRIIREETEKAIGDLQSVPQGRIKGIHEARKCIKKIRAVLRLVQTKLGEHFATANRAYRDISRQLSGPRDAEAIIECVDRLAATVSDPQHGDVLRRIRATLVERRDAVVQQSIELNDKVAGLAGHLGEVHAAAETWVIRPNSFASIAQGLERAYKRGRKCMKEAYRAPTDEHFHEWRKEVKAHWYHVRLLRGIWPKVMIALENELSTLADLLGDDHDLSVLRDALAAGHWTEGAEDEIKPVLAWIRKRRQQIRRTAHSLAQHLYVEKPAALRKRFQKYWVFWHREAKGVEEFQVTGPGDQVEPPPQIVVEPVPVAEEASSASGALPPVESQDAEVDRSEEGRDTGESQDVDAESVEGSESDEAAVVGTIHIVSDNLTRNPGRVV